MGVDVVGKTGQLVECVDVPAAVELGDDAAVDEDLARLRNRRERHRRARRVAPHAEGELTVAEYAGGDVAGRQADVCGQGLTELRSDVSIDLDRSECEVGSIGDSGVVLVESGHVQLIPR